VPANTATNTPTATPKPPTSTPRATNTPTATSAPPAGTGDIQITEILFDGAVPRSEADEYVEIKNFDNKVVQLKGWKLQDKDQNHTYTFPLYGMKPGETCRVYTNQNHPEWCGFNWRNGSAIWNNDGDTATLKDSSGKVIDTCSYTGNGTKVRC
jgi:competence protein ComEC